MVPAEFPANVKVPVTVKAPVCVTAFEVALELLMLSAAEDKDGNSKVAEPV